MFIKVKNKYEIFRNVFHAYFFYVRIGCIVTKEKNNDFR